MARQHATPLLLSDTAAVPLAPLGVVGGADTVSEAEIQALIFAHPSCLPIAEIDPIFCGPVPICTELNTPAGPVDALMITPSGLPVLVECKLWRNPEARREVVGQILDYAKEISRWSSSDLQREVSRRLKKPGNPMLNLIRASGEEVDEIGFNDALTLNLRRGRFLLLIVGDGIREGVETIAEYLQAHAGLHFTLGLVEMPIFVSPTGQKLVVPRVLTRTRLISREVVAVPEGYSIRPLEEPAQPLEGEAEAGERLLFLRELLDDLSFSDPEQPVPKPTPKGYLFLYMPAPKSSCWINISVRQTEVGLWLVASKDTPGDQAIKQLADDWEKLRTLLGGSPELRTWRGNESRYWIAEFSTAAPFADPAQRQTAILWLRERMNSWVAVLRPRIRAIVAELQQEGF